MTGPVYPARPQPWEAEYRPVARIGRGRDASIYLCEAVGGGALCAARITTMPEHATAEERARLLASARAAFGLQSRPNLVRVARAHRFFEAGHVEVMGSPPREVASPVAILRYFPCGDLARVMRRLPARARVRHAPWVLDAALAVLEELLAVGVFHRDLHPGNLLVGDLEGCAALFGTDFDLARASGAAVTGGARLGYPLFRHRERVAAAATDADWACWDACDAATTTRLVIVEPGARDDAEARSAPGHAGALLDAVYPGFDAFLSELQLGAARDAVAARAALRAWLASHGVPLVPLPLAPDGGGPVHVQPRPAAPAAGTAGPPPTAPRGGEASGSGFVTRPAVTPPRSDASDAGSAFVTRSAAAAGPHAGSTLAPPADSAELAPPSGDSSLEHAFVTPPPAPASAEGPADRVEHAFVTRPPAPTSVAGGSATPARARPPERARSAQPPAASSRRRPRLGLRALAALATVASCGSFAAHRHGETLATAVLDACAGANPAHSRCDRPRDDEAADPRVAAWAADAAEQAAAARRFAPLSARAALASGEVASFQHALHLDEGAPDESTAWLRDATLGLAGDPLEARAAKAWARHDEWRVVTTVAGDTGLLADWACATARWGAVAEGADRGWAVRGEARRLAWSGDRAGALRAFREASRASDARDGRLDDANATSSGALLCGARADVPSGNDAARAAWKGCGYAWIGGLDKAFFRLAEARDALRVGPMPPDAPGACPTPTLPSVQAYVNAVDAARRAGAPAPSCPFSPVEPKP